MFTPDFEDPSTFHHVQMLCEVHRYVPIEGRNLSNVIYVHTYFRYGHDVGHRTDAVTVHGLDAGDRAALLSKLGSKVNEKIMRNCPPETLVFNDVEHMSVSIGM